MSVKGLFEIVGIEDPSEFTYFENLADLLETDEYIEESDLEELLRSIDKDVLSELLSNYFDEFQKMIPEEETDFFVTVDTISKNLLGSVSELAKGGDPQDTARSISVFRKWYLRQDNVFDLDTGEELSVRDALFNLRADKLTGSQHHYNFGTALEYEADSYSLLVDDLVQTEFNSGSDHEQGTDMGYVPDNPYSGLSEDEIIEILDEKEENTTDN